MQHETPIPHDQPTDALPGTTDKVKTLAHRYQQGLGLWHPQDYIPMRDESHRRRELFGSDERK